MTQVTKCVPKVSIDDRLPTHNRFAILNSIDNTECVVNNVEKVVDRLSDQFVDCKYDTSDAVNTSLLCNDSKRLQQLHGTDNTSHENNNTATVRGNNVTSCQSKVTDAGELKIPRKNPKDSHPSVNLETDKLGLRFRPHHRNHIAVASDNSTFRSWNNQTQDKFRFILLGDLTLPPIDLQNQSKENIFDIHRRIKVSDTHNFMQSQIQVQSQLKPEVWQKYLTNYWDSQLVLLLRYGFPLDFDYTSPLQSVQENHSSATEYTKDVQATSVRKKGLGLFWGLFKKPQLKIFTFHHF